MRSAKLLTMGAVFALTLGAIAAEKPAPKKPAPPKPRPKAPAFSVGKLQTPGVIPVGITYAPAPTQDQDVTVSTDTTLQKEFEEGDHIAVEVWIVDDISGLKGLARVRKQYPLKKPKVKKKGNKWVAEDQWHVDPGSKGKYLVAVAVGIDKHTNELVFTPPAIAKIK